jgi:RES domain-containing protein
VDRSVIAAVASAPRIHIHGRFQRHTSPQYRTLKSSYGGGRWGPAGAFPVLYLGRPLESVIAEAYRALVDPIEGMRSDLVGPRVLLTCDVSVSDVLDLRDHATVQLIGLTPADLESFDHAACQRVGSAAHQLGLSGILAPAATRLGETLALFERNVASSEAPELVTQEVWAELPPDPREIDLPLDELHRRRSRP